MAFSVSKDMICCDCKVYLKSNAEIMAVTLFVFEVMMNS